MQKTQKTQKTQIRSLSWEDALEEAMATHSSILAWRIPWTEEPDGLQSMGCKESGTTEVTECTGMHTHGCLACFDMTSPWMLLGLSTVKTMHCQRLLSAEVQVQRGSFLAQILSVSQQSRPQILIKHLPYSRPRARPRQETAKKEQGRKKIIILLSSQITGSNHSPYSIHTSKGFTYLIHLILKAQSDVSTVAICLFQRS